MDLVPMAGQVGAIGKPPCANIAGVVLCVGQVSWAGERYPAHLRGAKFDTKILVGGGPAEDGVSSGVIVYPGGYVGGAKAGVNRARGYVEDISRSGLVASAGRGGEVPTLSKGVHPLLDRRRNSTDDSRRESRRWSGVKAGGFP